LTDPAAVKRLERERKALGQIYKRGWFKPEDAPQVDAMSQEADRAVKKHDEGEK